MIKRSLASRLNAEIVPSEITDHDVYLNRRQFMARAGGAAAGAALVLGAPALSWSLDRSLFANAAASPYSTDEKQNTIGQATSYNNFWEFGKQKSDPAKNSKDFQPRPWQVTVSGEVGKPLTLDVDDLIGRFSLQERIYRLRCVEGWSMVIPWAGFPLSELISAAEPTSKAKFVHFVTLYSKEKFPAHKNNSYLPWPYEEALRLDEAMNELTLMAVGMYGQEVANTNGAPLRLLVPWKYGFKSIKSIVSIELTEEQPKATWNQANPRYYGWYSNVNPRVNPVPYSQATETRIGENRRRRTELFNGYEEHVAHLYEDLDLRRNY